MIQILPITIADVHAFKTTRLAALRDATTAFGSTFAKESQLTDDDWLARVRQWNGERSIACLAWADDSPCGIVAGYLDKDDPGKAHLVSMWVAPPHRRLGVGALLVSSVIAFARQQRLESLYLMVTSNNAPAMRFYEKLGFTTTGRQEPYPNDPALFEHEMKLSLADSGVSIGRGKINGH